MPISRKSPMPNTKARWDISIWAQCPFCNDIFDVLQDDDYFVANLSLAEVNTERTMNRSVACSKCGQDFLVDLEY